MKDHGLDESLSALFDGELPAEEAEQLLAALRATPELRARWAAWQRVSAALGGQRDLEAGALADRVRAALEREPTRHAEVSPGPAARRRAPTRRARYAFALAASAAGAAVLVAAISGQDAEPPAAVPLARVPAPPEPAADGEPARLAWDDAGPVVARRLNAYLLNHSDYTSEGVRGLLAYARVVGYDGAE